MPETSPVLVSWVAKGADPFEREKRTQNFAPQDGKLVPGPTLSILFNEESRFKDQIHDVVLLHRHEPGQPESGDWRSTVETKQELAKRNVNVLVEAWESDDPIDHKRIYDFLRKTIPAIRSRFKDRVLIINASPGTPAMHTMWVLMAETGLIPGPMEIVQIYPSWARKRGQQLVERVSVGLESFYKVYQESRASRVSSEDQDIRWNQANFKTQRMKDLYAEACRFAKVKVPVLLLGERGTGKTELAKWIRFNSPFRRRELDKAWPTVPCGQFDEQTMRAELFGYKAGSFTGAIKDRDGMLAKVDGDSLFLDEIGDVSRDLQRLLIKAVEEREYLRIGDDVPQTSDFRLLSATNLDDAKLRRRLDPDFRDRISYLTLRLPALREVPEEIDWLWESIFTEASRRAGVRLENRVLSEEDHEKVVLRLRNHPLPGNMRDLFRVAFRMVAALADRDGGLTHDGAVEYGLAALTEPRTGDVSAVSRQVARSFAEGASLQALFSAIDRLSTTAVDRDIHAFIAREIQRQAGVLHRPIKEFCQDFCDVTDRTIREWAKPQQNGTELPTDGALVPPAPPKAKGRKRQGHG